VNSLVGTMNAGKGVIPGWTIGPTEERYDHVTLYQELAPVN
jgi:hypothetical protein